MLQPVVDWPTDEPPCEGVNDAVLRKVTEYALGLQNHHDLTKLLLKLNLTHEEISEFINVGAVSTNASVVATRCRPNSCNYSYCDGAWRDALLAYRSVHGYVALVVCVFGIVANVLNVIVLTRKELASAPINRILTWLAVADLQVMIEYVPFAAYMYLVLPGIRDYPWLGACFVLFHSNFAQVLHTISIFLTIALAVWRFISIKYPQHQHSLCTMQRCKAAIACSFALPILVCAPSYFTFGIHESPVQDENATVYHLALSALAQENNNFLYKLNFWVYAVFIKLLPCFILTLISAWLINTLYRASRRREQLRGYSAVAVLSVQNGNCNGGGPHGGGGGGGGGPPATVLGQANGLQHLQQQVRRPTRAEKRTDRTTRMLVAILVLFLCTEFPQGILILLSVILGNNFFSSCYLLHGELMDFFALLNGAINFILYCAMSRQFRTTFGRLFKPRGLMAKFHGTTTSQTEVASTYV